MAKITAPLLSLSATGKIGKTLNFKTWGDISCVRLQRKPRSVADPRTIEQVFFRDYFSDVVKVWQFSDSVYKSELDEYGEPKHQSGFNFHVRAYFLDKPTACGVSRLGFSMLGDLT